MQIGNAMSVISSFMVRCISTKWFVRLIDRLVDSPQLWQCEYDANPLKRCIRLGREHSERRTTLLALKPAVIHDAIQVFIDHCMHLTPNDEFSESRRFQAQNGDVCAVKFEVKAVANASTVKQVFDVLRDFERNVEVNATEVLGDITIRENSDDSDGFTITQHRLVSSISDVLLMDTNNVIFAEYMPQSPLGRELGLIVSEAVDEDDMFPYRPTERARQDITILDVVTKYPIPDADDIVMVTRWQYSRVHKSEAMAISRNVVDRILQGTTEVDQFMWSRVNRCCS